MKIIKQEVLGYVKSFTGSKEVNGSVVKTTWENGLITYITSYNDGNVISSSVCPTIDITQTKVLEILKRNERLNQQ